MAWDGQKLKSLVKERGISLTKLAEHVNVSRQTVNDWIKGQIPKGTYLIAISRELDTSPSFFFTNEKEKAITVPLHRRRGVARVTGAMKQESEKLAAQYEKLFRFASDPGLVPVLRIDHLDDQNAMAMASALRNLSNVEINKPMNYEHTFRLISELKVIVIFRYFPKAIKGYAFYCKIHKYRVVLVNNDTNLLDLIFPLLHETIHAILDKEGVSYDTQHEEDFCDGVANYIQFPNEYVEMVYKTIQRRRAGTQINLLKSFCEQNSHSMHGIIMALKKKQPSFELNVWGADTNLKKIFLTIGDILFQDGEVRSYIQALKALSPLFLDIVAKQLGNASKRKVGEWLGLESLLDADQTLEELEKIYKYDNP